MQTDAATRGGTTLLARLCRRMRALARTRAQPFTPALSQGEREGEGDVPQPVEVLRCHKGIATAGIVRCPVLR